MSPQVAPYGHWTSPLTAERLAKDSITLHELAVDESSGAIYSIECHPTEDGRYAIVQHQNGTSKDILPRDLSAHGTVQELGGGSIAMRHDGQVLFVDEESCNLYLLNPATSEAKLVHAAAEGFRYADFSSHPSRPEWIVAIKEDHREATPETQATHVHNTLVAINIDLGTETTVARGDDFYSHPKFDPTGRYVSWIQWSHPDMPWTGTVLYYATWNDGALENVTRLAGKAKEESIAQPKWNPDGLLYFASDRSGFWQLYSFDPKEQSERSLSLKTLEESDFANDEWELGSSTYIFLDANTIVATTITHATGKIILIDTTTSSFHDLELPYVSIYEIRRVSPTSFVVVGTSATTPEELALITITSGSKTEKTVLTSTATFELPAEYVSVAKELTAPQKHGPLTDGPVHMFYYPPRNPEFRGGENTSPPLLTYVHGGPNGSSSPALDLEIQSWTTRGYAVCAVNYTGSTGFGREYRERLSGYWGLVDVGDAVSAVEYLIEQGLADATRIGIYGQSAGGYLTLRALHLYPDVWAAGISSYGISDVRALQADSYKFESQDVDRLLLSKTDPVDRARELIRRSPCHFAGDIKGALLLLQGTTDMVVPVAQARMMADAMRAHGRVAEVVEFEGEGHGWVGQDAIYESLTRKEQWWREHLA